MTNNDVSTLNNAIEQDAKHIEAANNSTPQSFQFTGKGSEYFRIWIVNILLSIITLGIYSAWAKVRTQRYFYGNTYLGDTSFEYNADPVKILKGRIIAFFAFIIYSIAGQIEPVLGLCIGLLLMAAIPWVIVNALRFNARVTTYRGIAFDFKGSIGQAAKVFILWPFLAMFSFFILMPYSSYRQAKFFAEGHYYGKTAFDFSSSPKQYFSATLIPMTLFIIALIALGFGFYSFVSTLKSNPDLANNPSTFFKALGFAYVALILAGQAYGVKVYNLLYDNLTLKKNQFSADMKVTKWLWILISNTILTLVTLGIFYPWARVRSARYKAQITQVNLIDIDNFNANEQQQKSAIGEEIGEAFDIGFEI